MPNSQKPLEITVRTYDKGLDTELKAYLSSLNVSDVTIGRRVTTFDCGDPSVIEPLLAYAIAVTSAASGNLTSHWLINRFAKKSPESVAVNNQPMPPAQITVVINNYYNSKPEDDSSR